MDTLPFIQENLSDNIKIRTFKSDVESGELMWHRDREDRLVEILECNNWKYQSDNTLPLEMKKGDKNPNEELCPKLFKSVNVFANLPLVF